MFCFWMRKSGWNWVNLWPNFRLWVLFEQCSSADRWDQMPGQAGRWTISFISEKVDEEKNDHQPSFYSMPSTCGNLSNVGTHTHTQKNRIELIITANRLLLSLSHAFQIGIVAFEFCTRGWFGMQLCVCVCVCIFLLFVLFFARSMHWSSLSDSDLFFFTHIIAVSQLVAMDITLQSDAALFYPVSSPRLDHSHRPCRPEITSTNNSQNDPSVLSSSSFFLSPPLPTSFRFSFFVRFFDIFSDHRMTGAPIDVMRSSLHHRLVIRLAPKRMSIEEEGAERKWGVAEGCRESDKRRKVAYEKRILFIWITGRKRISTVPTTKDKSRKTTKKKRSKDLPPHSSPSLLLINDCGLGLSFLLWSVVVRRRREKSIQINPTWSPKRTSFKLRQGLVKAGRHFFLPLESKRAMKDKKQAKSRVVRRMMRWLLVPCHPLALQRSLCVSECVCVCVVKKSKFMYSRQF